MKILIVSASDIAGGANKAAYRLHRSLLNQGLDSQMLVQNKKSDEEKNTDEFKDVLTVSNGIKLILHNAATPDAQIDLNNIGKSFVVSLLFKNVITPTLAAVSPNLDNGP